jgi:hypothetical protein
LVVKKGYADASPAKFPKPGQMTRPGSSLSERFSGHSFSIVNFRFSIPGGFAIFTEVEALRALPASAYSPFL